MVRVSLHEGPDLPLYEAVKVKHGLSWRHQNIGDGTTLGKLKRELLTRSETSPRERIFVAIKIQTKTK